ncbi:MAG: hypothetical protein GY946_24720 [bacterium]|nr:hypothetical protein [bacterium]
MTETRGLRGRIRDAVSRLHRVDDELAELAESLVLCPDAVEMWESRIPTGFQVNLYAALDAVRSDCIQDAITTLLHAAGQSDASLRRQFLRRQLLPVEPVEFVARVAGSDAVEPGAELGAVGGRRKRDGVPFRVDKHSGEAGRKETPSC